MERIRVGAGEAEIDVRLDGPESKHVVLLLPGAGDPADVYDAVAARLHNSGLRTVAPETIEGLDQAGVLAMLDQVKVGWANLVGVREGAELAWLLAARTFGRFASLVVVDRPHPKVLGIDCAPVELPTTVMIGHAADRAQADQSGRFVYSDFRVVALDGIDNIPAQASHEMATEIVLRTSSW